jgi:hypothetical protein
MYNKYKAKKAIVNGIVFDSRKEAKRYRELVALEDDGEITELKRQVPFEIVPKQDLLRPVEYKGKLRKTERAAKYVADFTYRNKNGELIVEDTKGVRTADYILKRKLMLHVHGIQITEV